MNRNRQFCHTRTNSLTKLPSKRPGTSSQSKFNPQLSIDASDLIFYGNKITTKEITLQNKGNSIVHISLLAPSTQYFILKQLNRSFSLSPGISKIITIECKAPLSKTQFYDQLVVRTPQSDHKIGLQWFNRQAEIKYQKIVDLGIRETAKSYRFNILFQNNSQQQINNVELSKDISDNIQVNPDRFSLSAGQKIHIQLSVCPSAMGAFHHKLSVSAEGRVLQPIQIVYSCFDFHCCLQNKQGIPVKELEFGNLIRGQKKDLVVYLRNNSSEEIQVKTKIKLSKGLKPQSSFQSPQELAYECNSTVIISNLKTLKIKPFSRQKLILTAISKVQSKHKTIVQRLACCQSQIIDNALKNRLQQNETEHNQLLICEIAGNVDASHNLANAGKNMIILPMHAKFNLPCIALSPSSLDLGRILMGNTRAATITLQNLSLQSQCQVVVNRLVGIQIFNPSNLLSPRQIAKVQLQLKANNIGPVQTLLKLNVAQNYVISIPLKYQVHSDNLLMLAKQSAIQQKATRSLHGPLDFTKTALLSSVQAHRENNRPNFLSRSVSKGKADRSLMTKTASGLRLKSNGSQLEENEPVAHSRKYGLFVTKKIDKYVPFGQNRQQKKLHKIKQGRDYFSTIVRRAPKNRRQAAQIERQLSPDQLKMISINQKSINFGRMFINSSKQQQFVVTNQTDGAIIVQLHKENIDPSIFNSISESDFEPQIIASAGVAKFNIAFQARLSGSYSAAVTYSINKTSQFQLLIQAEVEMASLVLSKSLLRLNYLDQINQILLQDSFSLKNQGNRPVQFSIEGCQKLTVEPQKKQLATGQSVMVQVTQKLGSSAVMQAGQVYNGKGNMSFDDKLTVKIQDGDDVPLKVSCASAFPEPRCFLRQSKLDFGNIAVSKPVSKSFQLKNISRSTCIFQLQTFLLSEQWTFDCLKGRIAPQGSKDITVTYLSNKIHNVTCVLPVVIRGGLIFNLPMSVQTTPPLITVLQKQFAFDDLSCSTAGIRPITIRNDSEAAIDLLLDLTQKDKGVEYLSVSLKNSFSFGLEQASRSKTISQDLILKNVIEEKQVFKLKIQARSNFMFWLVFRPKVIGYYQFSLPLFLENYVTNSALSRVVSCTCVQPRFVVWPACLRFKQKIINDSQKTCFQPLIETITLRNPTDKSLKWRIEMNPLKSSNSVHSKSQVSLRTSYARSLNQHSSNGYFQFSQKRGQLKAGQSKIVKVSFNPLQEGSYSIRLPLQVFNNERGVYQSQGEIQVEGQGKYPSLFFSQHELILPVVPLAIQSLGMIRVCNQGYESIQLKHRFELVDQDGDFFITKGNLQGQENYPDLSVHFPQGNKLVHNKHELVLIVRFFSKRSLSFSCKLQLFEEGNECQAYSIALSATSDNSILTNYSFITDPQNIFKLQQQAILQSKSRKNKEETHKKQQKMIQTVKIRQNDGRNIVDRYHHQLQGLTPQHLSLDCRIPKRWINFFLREQKVRKFPQDLLNGETLFRVLFALTGKKQFDLSADIKTESKRETQTQSQLSLSKKLVFFQNLIKNLKKMGCQLNHIRPYFLCNRQEYMEYIQKQQGSVIYADHYRDVYTLLHEGAWLGLFYQIVLHFWIGKIRPQHHPLSNLYSSLELQILKWMRDSYEAPNPLSNTSPRFLSFSECRDCLGPLFCLLRYSPPTRREQWQSQIIRRPLSRQQRLSNTKLLYRLLEQFYVVPFIDEDEFQSCSQKEYFMFMYQLYEVLPQSIPKTQPMLFACQIGQTITKTIDINNPSSKPVHYWIKIQGSRDFYVSENEAITVEPKSCYSLTVYYRSRMSQEQTALLYLHPKLGQYSSATGTTLVFQLKNQITGRKILKQLQDVSSPLYQQKLITISVENPFDDYEMGNFEIIFQQDCLNRTAKIPSQMDLKKATQFYTDMQLLKVKRGSSTTFEMYYTPLQLASSVCRIIFRDPLIGQFQYQITGKAQLPRPLMQLKHSVPLLVGTKDILQLNLPLYNSFMLKCHSLLNQRSSFKPQGNQNNKSDQSYKIQVHMQTETAEFVEFPQWLHCGSRRENQALCKLKVQYCFPAAFKEYVLDFSLVGDVNREIQDVRRFRFNLCIIHPPLQEKIIMTTTARKPINQNIPIVNQSAKDWKLKISLLDNQQGWLSLKQSEACSYREMNIKKGQNGNVMISFDPQWVGECLGKININNTTTNQQMILDIQGLSEEPLSENHFYLRTNTQESTLLTIPITNPYPKKLIFKCLSDLDQICMPPVIQLGPNQTIDFSFVVQTLLDSPQIGFIKFQDSQGRFFWYTLTLESSQKRIKQFFVALKAQVDHEVQKVVQFKNPLSKTVEFHVQLPQKAPIKALSYFSIPPTSSFEYRLKYYPRKMTDQEVTLVAVSKQLGSFTYHLKLSTHQQLKAKNISISSQVGKNSHLQIPIYNQGILTAVNYKISNENCFQIEGPSQFVPGNNTIKLVFKPKSQGKHKCTLKVTGEHLTTRLFQIEGTGIAPYSVQKIIMKAAPYQKSLEVIKFISPHICQRQVVKVHLNQDQHKVFSIFGHDEAVWQSEASDMLAIPVEFAPLSKGYFQGVILVQCGHYQWKYLLKANSGFNQTQKVKHTLKVQNKQQIVKMVKISIPEYLLKTPTYFDRIEIEHSDKNLVSNLKRWLKIKVTGHSEQENDRNITLYLKFTPKKIMKQIVKLSFSSKNEEGPKFTQNILVEVIEGKSQGSIPFSIKSIKPLTFDVSLLNLGIKGGASMAQMSKGHICEASVKNQQLIRVMFKPSYLIFHKTNVYTDSLVVMSQTEDWKFQLEFKFDK